MLTKTSLQVVQALTELAKLAPGEREGAGSIARKIKAPQNYLGKMLQALAGEGLVESRKGLGGGFALSKSPDKISLYDVVEPIEDISRWSECVLGRSRCSDGAPCAIHERWKIVREADIHVLDETTIADLAK